MKIKVGITGQSGFMGTHLFNFLTIKSDEIELMPFEDSFFENDNKLKEFIGSCDKIVHLAGMNRHGDSQVIYDTNIRLANQLIKNASEIKHFPHIIFSSSIQEDSDNPYGRSKKEARLLMQKWAEKNNVRFNGLIIPNVFGPFGKPFYNSVIATFSYQLTHNQEPKIQIDSDLKLIYINELTEIFYKAIKGKISENEYRVEHTSEYKVSDILEKMKSYKTIYLQNKIIPDLWINFDIALFNTFRSYIDYSNNPVYLDVHSDNRGNLFEIIRTLTKGQIFYSTTKPGITRGNHYHTRKIERFCVIGGKALIKLRKIGVDKVYEYEVNGDRPSFIDIPLFHVHSITNIGNENLFTLFWTNELFDPEDPDTFSQLI
ncbi:MAG: NAD-dependent epimerase/dehydratase family protein [Bacteroidota bacterium]|nr:NAD-dependent epimerase/dehydratase family protein [Bacteroidota bacterium]